MSFAPRSHSLSLEDQQRVNRICTLFEDEWLAGRRPAIEPFLCQIPPAARPVLLGQLLLLELDYRRSLNEPVAVDDYLERFPRLPGVIRETFQAALAREATARFLPGSRIGRYEVRQALGTGAFATVYLAWDTQLERDVAIKVPHRDLLADEAARRRFLQEARTVAKLRHPHIVALYDVGELEGGIIYLVMPYVAGESLRQRLQRGPLPPAQAARIAAQVADAMAVAHQTGIFHRDLKPGNILLDEQGDASVCDFGLALQVENQREHRGEWAGTLAYMAPEQMRGQSHQLDGRADIWALGVIHYEMLTGTVPFSGENRRELQEDIFERAPRPPRQFDPRIAPEQERICQRCLEKEPGGRYATAADLAASLRALERPGRGGTARWAALLAATVLLPVVAWVWTSLRSSHAPDSMAALPLQGTLQLLVWRDDQEDRQGLPVDHAETLPVRNGDRVRIAVQLNQPGFLYLLWRDAHGAVLPVYPWQRGEWERQSADQDPRLFLALPDAPDDGWNMRVSRDGVETLLLLARRTPLPHDTDLPRLLAPVSQPPPMLATAATWFQDGQPWPGTPRANQRRERPPELQTAVRIPDPLLRMHREMAHILRPHFEFMRAVSFPVRRE